MVEMNRPPTQLLGKRTTKCLNLGNKPGSTTKIFSGPSTLSLCISQVDDPRKNFYSSISDSLKRQFYIPQTDSLRFIISFHRVPYRLKETLTPTDLKDGWSLSVSRGQFYIPTGVRLLVWGGAHW